MEIIAFIKSVVYAMLLIVMLIYKYFKKMKNIAKGVKDIFSSKKNKSNETKVSSNSIPDPKGKPPKGPIK